jgi:molybdate transport system substrate-binding protein
MPIIHNMSRRRVLSATASLIAAGALPDASWAQQPKADNAPALSEVTTIGPGGIRAPLNQLTPLFEKATGHPVKVTTGSGEGTKQQVIKGEAFDVPIVQAPVDQVEQSGNVDVKTKTVLTKVFVGIAVRQGLPKPDISSADAVRTLFQSVKAIACPNGATGAGAGLIFDAALRKLGLYDEVKPKVKLATSGANAMALLAKGDVDIGLTYISEILPEPGVELVGPLPNDVADPTTLIGYVSSHAKDRAAAQAFLEFLSSPEAADVYRSKGMVPGGAS